MKHCANNSCPDVVKYGRMGEYLDSVHLCPKCGNELLPGSPPEPPELEWRDLVPVASYREGAIAHIHRASLEATGIPAVVQNEHLVGLEWTYSQALGGVRLLVPPDRLLEARELLKSDGSADLRDLPEASLPPAADERCPRCHAEAPEPSGLRFRIKAVSVLLGIPLPVWREQYSCKSCGHKWRESEGAA